MTQTPDGTDVRYTISKGAVRCGGTNPDWNQSVPTDEDATDDYPHPTGRTVRATSLESRSARLPTASGNRPR
ncbi:hypothetical protein C9J85_03910 [Haloferax sp. wsp5]|nr:hypothetical protein C9J85_03910 [Haloferax sp. wsp5]